MSKIIIGIHGLDNKPPWEILQRSWEKAVLEGLKEAGYLELPFRFSLVYWANLIYPEPLHPEETDTESPLYDDEPYVPAGDFIRKEPSELRKKVLTYLSEQIKALFLNEDMSINFSSITDAIIQRYFKELDLYYCTTCIMKERSGVLVKDVIREQLTATLRHYRDSDILLIAHSMGSIIAYDVLTQCTPDITIDTFVTIGSPLGIPVVMSKIISEQRQTVETVEIARVPEAVIRRWYNLSDLDDNMTVNYKLSDDFRENSHQVMVTDIIVSNNYEYRGKKNPHKSYGYLRTPELAEIVYSFQNRDKK
jgi:hypothetical protein